jgi:hypothetical protein
MSERIGGWFRGLDLAVAAACVLGIAGALFMLTEGARWEWSLVGLFLFFFLRWFWRATARQRALTRHGFYAGRRIGARWVYDELHQGLIESLEFPVVYIGRGEYELILPGDERWRMTMPSWARDRRAEITERLASVFRRDAMRVEAGES